MDYIFGVVGFLGFEALRIYKCLWARRAIVPSKRLFLYIATIILLCIFAAGLAAAFAGQNPGRALWIGFSVPTAIRAVMEPARRSSIDVDDVTLERGRVVPTLFPWLKSYFLMD